MSHPFETMGVWVAEVIGWVVSLAIVAGVVSGLMSVGQKRNRTTGRSPRSVRTASDEVALNRIWFLLHKRQWDEWLVEDIAEVVEATGRTVETEGRG